MVIYLTQWLHSLLSISKITPLFEVVNHNCVTLHSFRTIGIIIILCSYENKYMAEKKEIQLFLYTQCFRFCTLTSFPSVPIYYFLIHHMLAYWPQIKWQLGYIFQDVKISGWKVNHLKVLSKWWQTWIYLETTLMFSVIETKQRVDNWIIHFSMRCFGVTRTLLKSPLPLVGLELWFQL